MERPGNPSFTSSPSKRRYFPTVLITHSERVLQFCTPTALSRFLKSSKMLPFSPSSFERTAVCSLCISQLSIKILCRRYSECTLNSSLTEAKKPFQDSAHFYYQYCFVTPASGRTTVYRITFFFVSEKKVKLVHNVTVHGNNLHHRFQ